MKHDKDRYEARCLLAEEYFISLKRMKPYSEREICQKYNDAIPVKKHFVKNCSNCGQIVGKNTHTCPTVNPFKGHHHTEKNKLLFHLNKVGKKGHPHTEEHKQHMSKIRKGIVFSEETRRRMSESGKGRVMSQIARERMSIAQMGRKHPLEVRLKISATQKRMVELGTHPNWRGGKTALAFKIRNSIEYRLWREAVFERDNYTCVMCSSHTGNGKRINLQADHIKPFALYPELRFAIDNGRTLCIDCHKQTPSYGGDGGKKYYERNSDIK